MTPAQLEQLKAMTPRERTSKYTPLMLSGKITKAQYEWIMGLGAQRMEVKEETNHPVEVTGKSQKARLLSLLSDGQWHDTVEILEKVYKGGRSGIARVGARIHDLKKDGHNIEGRDKTATVYEYRLIHP